MTVALRLPPAAANTLSAVLTLKNLAAFIVSERRIAAAELRMLLLYKEMERDYRGTSLG